MIIEILQDSWSVAEPIVGYTGIVIVIWYWTRLQLAKRRKYLNKGSKKLIVALQVGRPVAEAVKAHFGELDALIDVDVVLGKKTLDSEKDYKRLASEVYKALAQNQDSEIHLVISGPVGLNLLIGQLIGRNIFDITVYQYDAISKGYIALPTPDHNWL